MEEDGGKNQAVGYNREFGRSVRGAVLYAKGAKFGEFGLNFRVI